MLTRSRHYANPDPTRRWVLLHASAARWRCMLPAIAARWCCALALGRATEVDPPTTGTLKTLKQRTLNTLSVIPSGAHAQSRNLLYRLSGRNGYEIAQKIPRLRSFGPPLGMTWFFSVFSVRFFSVFSASFDGERKPVLK